MAIDYDTPRSTDDALDAESLEVLKSRTSPAAATAVDIDLDEQAEGLELPGADLSDLELTVAVIPKRPDEFTCTRCFLLHHRSRLVPGSEAAPLCRDCA